MTDVMADSLQKKLDRFIKKNKLTDSTDDLQKVKDYFIEKKQEAYKVVRSAQAFATLKPKITGPNAVHNLSALLEHDYTGTFKYDDAVPSDVWTLSKTYQGYFSKDLMGFMERFRSKIPGGLDFKVKARLEDTHQLIKGIFGESVKDDQIAGMVTAYSRANKAISIQLRKLGQPARYAENWMPQNWDAASIQKAGEKEFVDHMVGALDMSKTHGGFEDEAAFRVYLSDTYKDIVSNGYHTAVKEGTVGVEHAKGAGGGGMFNERSFQFKDADSFIVAHDKFGQGDHFENMIKAIEGATRELALTRVFGPSHYAVFHKLNNIAELESMAPSGKSTVPFKFKQAFASNESVYRYLSGVTEGQRNPKVAEALSAVRSLRLGAVIGSAPLSSLTDFATTMSAAKIAGIPAFTAVRQYMKLVFNGKATRAQAAAMGQVVDNMVTGSVSAARAVDERLGGKISQFSTRATEAVIRVSGLALHTQSGKNAIQMAAHIEYAGQAGKTFKRLKGAQKKWLEFSGITASDWDIIRAAVDDTKSFIDPEKISKFEVLEKWLSSNNALARIAIPEPGAYTQTVLGAGYAPGSAGKEIRATVLQLQSYSISSLHVSSQLLRNNILFATSGSKLGYLVSTYAPALLLAAAGMQLKSLSSGKDLLDISDPGMWGSSFANLFGVPGDLMQKAIKARNPEDLALAISGPIPGLAVGIVMKAKQLGVDVGDGETDKVYKDIYDLVGTVLSGMTPGNNLWYTKLAIDRLVKDQLQKIVDPDADVAFARAARNQDNRTGQGNWWERGEVLPDRFPTIAEAPSSD